MENKRKNKSNNLGLGSVFYNKQRDSWTCAYYITDFKTGEKKRCKKSFKTKEKAEQFFSEQAMQKNSTLYIENNGILLGKLIDLLLQKKYDSNLMTDRAYTRTKDTIRIISKCYLSNKKIDEITSEELQAYFNSLTTEYSNSSIQKVFFQIKNAFEYSINKGFIHENPMLEVLKPKSQKEDKVFHALQVDEQKALTEYIVSLTPEEMPYKNCILFELYLGLRVGEALALQIGDINLQRNIISINKTLTTDIDNQVCIGSTTKTYAGQRELPIPDFLRDFVIEQIEIAKEHKNHLLFTTPEGRLVNNSTVNRQLKKIAEQLEIKTPISTHVLRHTYGTRCIESGMRAVALQRLMGHTDISITLNTYTSIFNKYKLEEIEKVNDYFINNNILNTRSKFQLSDSNNQENDLEVIR